MAVFLVCEYAIDNRVLDQLVVQQHGLAVQIALAGGSTGLGAIRAYLQRRAAGDVAISVRDRDYDYTLAEAVATWTNTTGRQFVWRRHEVENYLLEPRAVLELFNEWRTLPWASGLPASEADVETLLWGLAVPLIPEHVAGVVRTDIIRATNALGSFSFTHPRVIATHSAATPGAAEWRSAVVAEAARLVRSGTELAVLPDLDPHAIGGLYDTHLAYCQSPFFRNAREYLRDLGGKELLGALAQYLHGRGAPGRLNSTALADALLIALARIYQPNTLFQPDDFAELGAVLAQY